MNRVREINIMIRLLRDKVSVMKDKRMIESEIESIYGEISDI